MRTFHLTDQQARRVHHALVTEQAELLKQRKNVVKIAMDENEEKTLARPIDDIILELKGKPLEAPGLLAMFAEQNDLTPNGSDPNFTIDDEIRRQAQPLYEGPPPEPGESLYGALGDDGAAPEPDIVVDHCATEPCAMATPLGYQVTTAQGDERQVRLDGTKWRVVPDEPTTGAEMTHVGDVVDKTMKGVRKRMTHRKRQPKA